VGTIRQEVRAKFLKIGDEVVRVHLDFLQSVVARLQDARNQRECISRLYVVHPSRGLGQAQRNTERPEQNKNERLYETAD
jgi:hypothetical protein